MYIITVYSLRVKKQAQFILKIATVQEILQKKREIALVNLSVRRVSTHLKFVLPPLYAPFSRSLAAENPDMQYEICSMRSGLFCLRFGAHSKQHPFLSPADRKSASCEALFSIKVIRCCGFAKYPSDAG